MNKRSQRALAVLLAVVLIVGMLPICVFAVDTVPFTANVGTASQFSDGCYLLEVPEGTTVLSITLDTALDICNEDELSYDWGDFDEDTVSYDSDTRTYTIGDLTRFCVSDSLLASLGVTDTSSTYYCFDMWTLTGNTDHVYYILVKAAAAEGDIPFTASVGTASKYADGCYVLQLPDNTAALSVTLEKELSIASDGGLKLYDVFDSWNDFDHLSYDAATRTYTMDLSEFLLDRTDVTEFGCAAGEGTYYYFETWDSEWETVYRVLLKSASAGQVVPAEAAAPVISRQPVAAEYVQGAAAAALTVEASVSAGTLSYAWYADGSDSVLSTEKQYVPATDVIGARTYFVIVTNTEDGKTPVSVTSEKVTVTITEPAGEAPAQNDDGVYQLGSAEDLFWFAETVNKVKYTSGSGWSEEAWIDAELTADIDLKNAPWTPIGTTLYCGHFNGNGFTVSGLQITSDEDAYALGFFGDVEEATIENLKVQGSIILTEDVYADYVGGIAAYAYDSVISNCRSDIEITAPCCQCAGGIAGCVSGEEVTIAYCTSRGDISAESADSGVGGLVGMFDCSSLTLFCCYQRGNVTGCGYVGGLIGESYGSELILNNCYTSASVEDGAFALPEGLEQTGLIIGECPGDLVGCMGCDAVLRDVYCLIEMIDGDGYLTIFDFENNGCSITIDNFSTPVVFLNALNGGSDTAAYVIDDNGGDSWPVLAWELKEGTSPDEQIKALNEAKANAKAEITALFTDTYKEADYEAADWTKIISCRDAALTAIEAAKDCEAITAALSTLKTNLQSVPTAATRLDDYKETACAAVEKAYYYQVVGTYSTSEYGYKADLTKYIGAAEKFGLMHGLREQLLRDLNGDLETLDQKKNEGLAAINAATSKAAADLERENALSNMEQVLANAKERTADNGVADKWDGTTQIQPSGSGTKASPYQIRNGAELAWFAAAVNGGSKSLYATLIADIDLNEKLWTPISQGTDDAGGYAGVFDGNGYQVHGLAVIVEKEGSQSYGGLFGNIGKNGVVKNVAVAGIVKQMLGNSNMNAMQKAKYAAGGIAGRSSGIIFHCESSVVLTNGTTYSNCNNIGGIVGYQVGGVIESCISYAILYKNGSANFQSGFGGVTGHSEGASLIRYTDSYANIDLGNNVLSNIGGITGTLTGRAQIRECRHGGTVVNGSGIAGNVLEQAGITYALNTGTVSGKNGIGESGIRPAAGMIGVLNSTGTVSYIYNTGDCVYGLVNSFQKGTVIHAQSNSKVSLWGTVDAQNAFTTDCLRVEEIELYESTESTGALAWAKLEATVTLLGRMKSATDATYAAQSTRYNAIVLQYIRQIELAKNADEIAPILSEAAAELNTVQTQLEAEKEKAVAAFDAYVTVRVYDETGIAEIVALLAEAKNAVNAAATLKALNNVIEEYLGTDEQPGRFETECDTYNTKARNELYNEFIYEKRYSDADMAAMLALYGQWAVRVDAASSVEAVETVFADARFALNEAASRLIETDTIPNMDLAAETALTLAREAAAKELNELAEGYKASIQALVDSTNGKGYANGIMIAIQNVKITLDAHVDAAATVDFGSLTDYAQIETAKDNAAQAVQEYAKKATTRINALIAEADKASDGAWDGVTVVEPNQDASDIYQISNGAELAWLAQKVNGGYFRNGVVNAVLTQDIDLGYNEWTPIGIGSASGKAFAGTFDGNGCAIQGLYFSETNDCGYYGLFGIVRNGAVIKDLTVKGTFQLDEVGNSDRVGSIAAAADYGNVTLKDCVSYVDIMIGRITNNAGALAYAGGLVGCAGSGVDNILITDSFFKGSITAENCNNNVRGIGGIVGWIACNAALVRNVNYGDVTVDKAAGVGGIVGWIDHYGNTETVSLTDCANLGNISNDVDNVMDAKGGTGGIVGIADKLETIVFGCCNTGTITASKIAGGILGAGGASLDDRNIVIQYCYNAGTVVGPNNQTANKIGSLVGYPVDGVYKDDLYVLEGAAQAAMGWKSSGGDRVYVVSSDELIRKFADGTNMVGSIAGLNKGYPLFAWQLLDPDNRQAVINYLYGYFEINIRDFASAGQKDAILKMLEEWACVILAATDADTVLAAYEAAIKAMDTETLLSEAKADAIQDLNDKIQVYLTKYPGLLEEIRALQDTMKADIELAKGPSDMDIVLDRLDAAVVDLLIADIGQINNDLTEDQARTAKEKIALAEDAYNSLNEAKKQQVSKLITLLEAKAAMNAYTEAFAADKAAADAVTAWIQAIGDVTLNSKDAIETALNGYEALTDKQKAMVSEEAHNTLLAAQTRYNQLVAAYNADVKAANQVIALINAIGTVTLDSKDAIDAANNAYNALRDTQKAMIAEETYTTLLNAAGKYAELAAAYTADQKAVQAVIDRIEAIGTVTLESKNAIVEASNAYAALTGPQAAMLSDSVFDVLVKAREQYVKLAAAYTADQKAARDVTDRIHAIGAVTLASGAAISAARTAYNALSDAQKAMVSAELLRILTTAEAQYDALVQAGDDKSDDTGTPDVPGDTTDDQPDATKPGGGDKTDSTIVPGDTIPKPEETDGPEDTIPSGTESGDDHKPVSTGPSPKLFDWSLVWIICAIVAVALVAFGMLRWFAVAKNKKRK